MSRLVSLAALSLVAGLGASSPARGQESSLGSVSFLNSGAQEAQDSFHRGLALLHSFEFGDARGAFREAQEIDPKFAMAYWGEAMAWNYPLWFTQYREEALQALEVRRYENTRMQAYEDDMHKAQRLFAAIPGLKGVLQLLPFSQLFTARVYLNSTSVLPLCARAGTRAPAPRA